MLKTRQRALAIIILTLYGLVSQAGQAQEFTASVLFTMAERRAIETALSLRPVEGTYLRNGAEPLPIPENRPSWRIERLHLSALIFYGPENWSFWLGNRQVRHHSIPPFLSNLRVTAAYVDFSVTPRPGADPIAVRLRPGQTFLIRELRIAEGD